MQRNVEQRYSIKFCVKLGLTPTDTLRLLQQAYGDETLNRTSVYQWHREFRAGRETVHDRERAGRPVSVTTAENVAKVGRLLVSAGRRPKPPVRAVAQQLNLSKSSTHSIMQNRRRQLLQTPARNQAAPGSAQPNPAQASTSGNSPVAFHRRNQPPRSA